MKKFTVSLILVVFLFGVFYPVIYATENVISNQVEENVVVEQEEEDITKIENTEPEQESEKKENLELEESVSEEEITEEIVVEEPQNTEQENVAQIDSFTSVQEEIKEETNFEQKQEIQNVGVAYKGDMFIDAPVPNKSYILPDDTTVKIVGWAVSNDKNAVLQIYVNDKKIGIVEKRVSRPDVDFFVSSEYGGTETTPNAGFEADLDISEYPKGTYIIKVEELSSTGEVVASENVTIKIAEKAYTGEMFIDTPLNNKVCILPETTKIQLSGWAVSNDEKAVVKLYVNDVYWLDLGRTSRPDVDKAFPKYAEMTPKAGYSYNVDISAFPEGMHQIRVDQVSRYGKVISSKETYVTVKYKEYTGEMFIDTPTNNKEYLLPDENVIKVEGWAVSDDEKAVVKLYVNNVYVSDLERIGRADVDKWVSPQYGGTVKTPKAGYSYNVDISAFPEGMHQIRVDQVSRYGKVISSKETYVTVKYKEYTGEMFIDTPTNNKEYLLPDENVIKVEGWAVSDDEKAVVKLYVNNVYVSDLERIGRADVDKWVSPQYGGTVKTPKAGYSYNVDISAFPEGMHQIRVDQVSRYGKVISSKETYVTVKYKEYTGEMFIDTPTNNKEYLLPDENVIKVEGWAVSNDEKAVVKLYVNDVYWLDLGRTNRPDVNKAFPKYAEMTTKAGYSYSVDVSAFPEGTHQIRVDQVSRYGKVISSDVRNIKISYTKYDGEMWIDSPVNEQTYKVPTTQNMKISGWAVANDSQAYISVLVDGQNSKYTVDRHSRTDVDCIVSPKYGGTEKTPEAGFDVDLLIGDLSEGTHTVEVIVCSRFHQQISKKAFSINVSTPDYEGKMCIDNPVQNRRYHSGVLEISGWALTENQGDYVEVHLDGKYITGAQRVERQDVLNHFGDAYGGASANPLPGFYSVISTEGLAEGTHTLKMVHYSSYKKKIQEAQVNFVISNTKIWGIDVSHHNGDINWEAVRNQGVGFAILKIGEFRESSGRIIQDEHFERNYNECKRLGIAVGGYFYSYAFDPTEASHEAVACLTIIQGKSFEMPIFLDIEDKIVKNAVDTGRTNVQNLTNGAVTFCQMMNNSGYHAGVYASKNFFYQYLDRNVLENYNIWLAHYVDSTDYLGRYDMWQYTSDGSLAGIDGRVDFNWCFKRY